MISELSELYQEVILDHQRYPRNFRAMAQPDRVSVGHNPLCGDKVTVYLKLADGAIRDVSFEGVGCAICTASASMMTERLKGMPLQEAENTFQSFHAMLTQEQGDAPNLDGLGKLRVFAGVRQFPVRVKCATLPWHTLRAAIEGTEETISTE